jgi:hypothetical protein
VRARLALALAACLLPAWAQSPPPAKKAAKPAAAKPAKAHRKATPEQIRRFEELEKKRQTTR